MFYYEVLVTQEYAARESVFTYASNSELYLLQFVIVPIQKKQATGIVVKNVSEPTFATKHIVQAFPFLLKEPQRHIIRFLKSYYGATEAQALQLFMPSYLSKTVTQKEVKPISTKAVVLPTLTAEQRSVLTSLRAQPTETVLLHGDTGTGKTRVYIERARDIINVSKCVLILCPEIGLVPHLSKQFSAVFGDQVVSYHSALKNSERTRAWTRIESGDAKIIIGTRSAVFLPLDNLGLIVIDESHEPAYKQEEGIRYHATRVASILAAQQQAQLILASATPLVSDMYLAHGRGKTILRMEQSAITSDAKVNVHIIDMKERAEFSTHPMLSNTLLHEVEQALSRGEQSMIYLNRRGTARAILCQTCGWQAMCPTCDTSLTYHHDHHRLRCHTCGYSTSVPVKCPTCSGVELLFKSAGTKALASWLEKRFPDALVGRFDTDNAKADSLQERSEEVVSGNIDILVGTQMLVKGLDLPSLSVVGIVAADLSLQIPDFSAEERTYQLVQQAMGRVGRGHRAGSTIIQTFNPNNKVIRQAISKNYDAFYTTQIVQRRAFDYSPITFMAVFWVSYKTSAKALEQANKILKLISKSTKNCTFLGPVTTFHPKKRGMFTAQIVVKTTQRRELSNLAKLLPSGWQYDLEPINLL